MDNKGRRSKLVLILSFLLIVVFSCTIVYKIIAWRNKDRIVANIGVFPNQVTEERAAIRCLSEELKKHPRANEFVICAGERTPWREGVVGYIRVEWRRKINPSRQIMWVDSRFNSPVYDAAAKTGIRMTGLVPERVIHYVANHGGDFNDIVRYTRKYWATRGQEE